jgi:hypothetical protein
VAGKVQVHDMLVIADVAAQHQLVLSILRVCS